MQPRGGDCWWDTWIDSDIIHGIEKNPFMIEVKTDWNQMGLNPNHKTGLTEYWVSLRIWLESITVP